MKKIKLTNDEFEGENNVYLIDGGDETALVDAGIASEQVRKDLEEKLADASVRFGDLD